MSTNLNSLPPAAQGAAAWEEAETHIKIMILRIKPDKQSADSGRNYPEHRCGGKSPGDKLVDKTSAKSDEHSVNRTEQSGSDDYRKTVKGKFHVAGVYCGNKAEHHIHCYEHCVGNKAFRFHGICASLSCSIGFFIR